MHQCQALRDWREIHRPVERRVAAAGDDDAAPAELLDFAHGIEHARPFIRLDAGNRRALRHEAAAARGDDDHGRGQHGSKIGGEAPLAVFGLVERGGHLAEMKDRFERLDLFEQPVGQLLAGADRNAGNVIDRLLGIKLGALSAGPVENVDEMGLQLGQAKLEHGEQAHWTRANNDHVGGRLVRLHRFRPLIRPKTGKECSEKPFP